MMQIPLLNYMLYVKRKQVLAAVPVFAVLTVDSQDYSAVAMSSKFDLRLSKPFVHPLRFRKHEFSHTPFVKKTIPSTLAIVSYRSFN